MRISEKQDMISGMGFIGERTGVYKMGPNVKTAEVSGTSPLVLKNGKNKPFKRLRLYGKSTQETTTGAQLFNVNGEIGVMRTDDANNISVNTVDSNVVTVNQNAQIAGAHGQKILVEPNMEYIFACDILSFGTGTRLYMAVNNQELNYYIKGFNELGHAEITINSGNNTELVFGFASYEGVGAQVTNVMLNAGSIALPWEPYTGGQASPNLDYPQEIVSSGMKWSTGKNLLRYPFRTNNSTVDGVTWRTYNCHVTGKGITTRGTNFTFFTGESKVGSYGVKVRGTLVGMNLYVYDITASKHLSPTNFTTEEGHAISIYLNQGRDGVNVDVDIDIVLAKAEDIDSVPFEPYTNGVKELYGDAVSVMVRGKNLLDVNLLNDINNFDRSYSSSGYAFFDMQVKSDTDITVSIGQTYSSGDHFLKVSAKKGATVAGTWMCHGTVKLTDKATIPAAQNKGHVYLYFSSIAAKIQEVLENIGYIQVEYGDKATAYEPYHEPQSLSIRTPNGLPGLPVNSGGNYTDADGQQWIADCIDFGREKYVQNIWTLEFNGIEDWEVYKTHPYEGFFLRCLSSYCKRKNALSNCLAVETNANVSNSEAIWIGVNNDNIYVKNSRFYDASLDDYGVSEWKKYLSEHPMTVMTYLDEPIERDLSAEEIAAYKFLKTYKGTTVVESDCYMDIKYNT